MSPGDLPMNNRLALDRTRLAYERTLMAWIRTAASLISFGFTIYKFFPYSLSAVVALFIAVLGILGLLSVLLRF
jgi:putative membrane protein